MLAAAAHTTALRALARATPRPLVTGSNRVLLVQPDHLGDILLSEPAVRYLRQRLPDIELIAVVGPWSAEIAGMAWPVDRVIEVEFPGFTRAAGRPRRSAPYELLRREIARIRKCGADDAVILRDDAWWAAWLAYGATGRHVVTSRDPRAAAFATRSVDTPATRHRTATAMDLAHAYLALRDDSAALAGAWDMSPRMLPAWENTATATAPIYTPSHGAPVVVIHPGSGAPVKAWPVRAWRSVAGALDNTHVVLTGAMSERELCDEIAHGMPHATVLAGQTSLRQLSSLLASATVAVGTDSGPLHLAGALGTPTVRLFGPSNPRRYGPWPGTAGQVVLTAGWTCPRCEDLSIARKPVCGCMAAIEPQLVLRHVRELLADGA